MYYNFNPYQYQPTYQSNQGMIWVGNITEAQNYPIMPNSAVTLWDSNSPCIYLKKADASGRPSLQIYDLVERTQAVNKPVSVPMDNYATKDDIAEINARIDSIMQKKGRAKNESVLPSESD